MKTINCWLVMSLMSGLLAISSLAYGQDDSRDGINHIEKSFGTVAGSPASRAAGSPELPVNLYTGAVSVNLPLFELPSRQLTLPVSLRYVSSGVPVAEASGWLGHTWQLNAGGAISRELRGLPDETPTKGYLNTGEQVQNFTTLTEGEQRSLVDASAERHKDTEPDIYHYNFAGRSGKFLFDHEQKIRFIPHQNFAVDYDVADNRLIGFTITTENGTKYEFGSEDLGAVEETKLTVLNYAIKFQYQYGTARTSDGNLFAGINYNFRPSFGHIEKKDVANGYYTSKWHLTKISAPNTDDHIDFAYTSEEEVTQVSPPRITESFSENTLYSPSETGGLLMLRTPDPGIEVFGSPFREYTEGGTAMALEESYTSSGSYMSVSRTKTQTKAKRLTGITTDTGNKVNLVKYPNSLRYDVLGGASSLAKIELINSQDKKVRSYAFKYRNIASDDAYDDPLSIDEAMLLDKYGVALTPASGQSLISARRAKSRGADIGNGDLKDFIFEGIRNYNYQRLFLEEVTEESESSSVGLSYRFSYASPEELPRRTSVKVGKTGFVRDSYSRRSPNKGFIRNAYGKYWERDFVYDSHNMFNQNYDVIYALGSNANGKGSVGMLKRITYPTGGSREFIYNNGTVATLRKVVDYRANDEVAMVKRLAYGKYIDTNPVLTKSFREYYYDDNQVSTHYTLTSYNQRGSGVGGSGFNRVTVYQLTDPEDDDSTVGKEEYDFTIPHDAPRSHPVWTPEEQNLGHITKVYSFPKEADYEEDYFQDAYPFPRDHDVSYKTGLLKRHATFAKNGKKKRETSYTYKFVHNDFPGYVIKGLTGGKFIYKTEEKLTFRFGYVDKAKNRYRGGLYVIASRGVYLDKKTEHVYEQDEADVITTITNYEYNPTYLQVKKETTVDSEGTEWVTEYGYPTDFAEVMIAGYEADGSIIWNGIAGNRMVASVQRMLTTHRHNPLIQTTLRRKRAGEDQYQTVSGELTLFSYSDDDASSSVTYPERYFRLFRTPYNPRPLPFTIEKNGDVLESTYDADYQLTQTYEAYDQEGNLLQSTGRDHIATSQLYGYQNSLPIAQAVGAGHNQIAYTGFEAPDEATLSLGFFKDREGNFEWKNDDASFHADAYTGQRSYSGSEIVCKDLPGGSYRISCWAKQKIGSDQNTVYFGDPGTAQEVGTDWTYLEWILSKEGMSEVPIFPNGNLIDEVRIHPVGAQMTTYTYDPLVGVTSETDANGITTHYEYDELNHLRLVKDHRRDIRQRYQYVYKHAE